MAHRYGSFVCRYCGKTEQKRSSRQFTCAASECQLARSRDCARRYRPQRRKKTITSCEWCDKPLPRGLRKYHTECRSEKDRARMYIYYWKKAAERLGPEEAKRRRRLVQERKKAC